MISSHCPNLVVLDLGLPDMDGMANIRRKIEKNPAEPHDILTEIGVGYRMAEAE